VRGAQQASGMAIVFALYRSGRTEQDDAALRIAEWKIEAGEQFVSKVVRGQLWN